MFVTKKKFGQLIKFVTSEIDDRFALVSEYLTKVEDGRKNGDDALNEIIMRHRLEAINAEGQTEGLRERLHEAETRIDNLQSQLETQAAISSGLRAQLNVTTDRAEKNEMRINEATCPGRLKNPSVAADVLPKPITDFSAIYFHYAEDLEVGLTYWLKVPNEAYRCPLTSAEVAPAHLVPQREAVRLEQEMHMHVPRALRHEMVQGKWDGMRFVLPDGSQLSHESVVEVGEIIVTPTIED